MKILKIISVPIFIAVIFFSCKKTTTSETATSAINQTGLSIKSGVVTFANIASYLLVTENKNDEQQKLLNQLQANNFVSLSSKKAEGVATTAHVANSINVITNAFDPTLYSNYLLTILNQDKICSINGFWVKVDMDNEFCTILDAIAYPNEYADLKNNVFTNSHVMTFVNPDEPVLEVINQMRNGTLTWASYQDQLAKKGGGGGICLGKGHAGINDTKTSPPIFGYDGLSVTATANYSKYFIHFELHADCSSTPWQNTSGYYYYPMYINFKWSWSNCVTTSVSSMSFPNIDGHLFGYLVYSAGSPLQTLDLKVEAGFAFSFAPVSNAIAIANIN